MSRQYCKGLTRHELENMGITSVIFDDNNNEWVIERNWYRKSSNTIKDHTTLKISMITKEHKYGKTKIYPKVQFGYRGKGVAVPLSRFVYTWFVEDIPDGYVIDHIDNDPFNNKIENLQMLSIEENLAKRYMDNPNNARNQWCYMDDFDRACDKYRRSAKRRMKEIQKSLAEIQKQLDELE